MASYPGRADAQSRAKAIVAVAAVHVGLGLIILSGLHVPMVTQAVDRLKAFNLTEPPPPPPPPPPKPEEKPSVKKAEGAPAKRADAAPVVAPPPRMVTSSPIPAAKVAGAGSASSSGAADAGNGTGAGGAGDGPGGGGTDYSRFTPARKITKIPDNQYRRFAETGLPVGSVAISIRVNPDGTVSNCRVVRSSGSSSADGLMCLLTQQYIRFSPARDPSGRAVAQDVTWAPNWSPRY